MPELRRFSHSLVECYLDCPRKCFFRYIEQVPTPKAAALVKGTACDQAWNYNLEQKIESKEDIALDDLLQITEQAFRDDVANEGGVASVDWGDSSARAELDSALRLSRTWRMELAPDIQPFAVQVRYSRPMASGREFIGFIDIEGLVDGAIATIDNKTAKRRFSAGDADRGLQPSAYAYLKGEPLDFVFARAIDTGKSQSSEFAWTHRSAGDIDWYTDLINQVELGFEGGVFPPNPNSKYGCNGCGYFAACQPHRTTSTTAKGPN